MGLAPVAYTLFREILKHNPKNPSWANRDRFILSAGHASMLLYASLYLSGYDVSLDDLKNFRQWGSKTPGHPEFRETPGVETTTGPLGQGISTAVGMAIAQRYLNSLFTPKEKPLLDYTMYGIASDGDMMEGISSEAASLAGHLGLGSLVFVYDCNRVTIDGHTDLSLTEDVEARYKAYHWHVQRVSDGNDIKAIANALRVAKAEVSKPSLIILDTHIGFGSPNKADSSESHGAPLGEEEVKLTKKNLGWPLEPAFLVPSDVSDHFKVVAENGKRWESEWQARFDAWAGKNPDAFHLWKRLEAGELPPDWEKKMPDFSKEEKMATRVASGHIINALAPILPELIGGSADLAGSNNTMIKGSPPFSKTQAGRNIYFGVREHAMGAVLNGLALTERLIPFGGTFLIFSDYMKGAIRIAALSKTRAIYIFTHDTIGLGEDGPTHQPIEQVAHLRAMPNILVLRPADAHETAAAWKVALRHKTGPVALILSRQALPVLSPSRYPKLGSVEKGAYVLSEAKSNPPNVILIATGSEVSLALKAQEKLSAEGIESRVVSMPSWELFEAQPQSYKDAVLPPAIKARVSIEALSSFGWDRYVGWDGVVIGMTTFGASAPTNVLMEKFGFTIDNIVAKTKALLNR